MKASHIPTKYDSLDPRNILVNVHSWIKIQHRLIDYTKLFSK